MESIRRLGAQKRAGAIERLLDERHDVDAVKARLTTALRELRGLRITANLLWVALFGGLAGVVVAGGVWLLVPLALVVFTFWAAHALMLRRAWRRLTCLPPELAPDTGKRLVALLSPLAGVRAVDLVMRELLGDLDPMAAAAALVAPPRLATFARPWLATLTVQRRVSPPGAQDDLAWWRQQALRRVERVLRTAGVDPQALLAPPARDGDQVQSWCPHCLAQFARPAGDLCPGETCPSIVLQGFGAASVSLSAPRGGTSAHTR